jgi:hypothetical protein
MRARRPATVVLLALSTLAACGHSSAPTDHVTWTLRESGFGVSAIVGATYGAGRFVIVGEGGKLATSTDGVAWELGRSTFGSSSIRNVVFADGRFVAVGVDASGQRRTISTSPDGLAWRARVAQRPETMRGAAFGDGVWIVVGDRGVMQRSVDLVAWSEVGPERDAMWISVIYARGRFVASGREESLAYSVDGSAGTWTVVDLGRVLEPGCELSLDCNDVDDVVHTGERFVAVTHPSAEVFTSPDLVYWAPRATGLPRDSAGLWVANYTTGLTVVAGGRGKLATSRDGGITWTPEDPGFGDDGIIAIARGRELLLAGGLHGRLATRPAR